MEQSTSETNAKAHVLQTTLSKKQFEAFKKKFAAEGFTSSSEVLRYLVIRYLGVI
jgi:hypothetical protein